MIILRKFLAGVGIIGGIILVLALVSLSPNDRRTLLSPLRSLQTPSGAREYLLGPVPSRPERILLMLPGYKDHARQMAYYTGMHNVAGDTTLVVYAQATESSEYRRGWNARICCGNGFYREVNDVAYLEALIAEVRQNHATATTPVYLAGFSNGAMMAQYFAGQRPELVAGIVAHAGTLGADGVQIPLSSPVPVLLMHGAKDTNVDFAGNFDDPGDDFDGWLSHEKTLQLWRVNNADQALVESRVYPNLSHEWPDWRLARLWHHHPEGSQAIGEFIRKVEN